jgi:hypothetical protein
MQNANEYFIEVFTNPYPETNKKFKVHKGRPSDDMCSPGMIDLLGPYDAHTKEEAIANAMISLGDYQRTFRTVIGRIKTIVKQFRSEDDMSDEVRQSILNVTNLH